MTIVDFIKGIFAPKSKEKPAATSLPKRKASTNTRKKSGNAQLARVTRPGDTSSIAIVASRKVSQAKQEAALNEMMLPMSPHLSRPIKSNKDSQTETIQSILPVKLVNKSSRKTLKG